MKIESLQNPKVKEWIKLKEKKYRDLNNLFLIEGDHLLNEAMIKGVVREIISVDKLFDFEGIPFYEVNDSIMKKLSNQVSGTNVICVCEKLREREIKGNVCLLDNIQDPGNQLLEVPLLLILTQLLLALIPLIYIMIKRLDQVRVCFFILML